MLNRTGKSRRRSIGGRAMGAAAVVVIAVGGVGAGLAPPATAGARARAKGAQIHDIQGSSHISPLDNRRVSRVPGVVTAVGSNQFWMGDPQPDSNPATSEGIEVYTSGTPNVAIGDEVQVTGTVSEYRPGGSSDNLTTTELTTPTVTVVSHDATLPAPTLVGPNGLTVPAAVRTDEPGDVESSSTFDPAHNALDFYESLEGMLVRIHDPVAVGPTNAYGELPVLPGGQGGVRTANGGIKYTGYDDSNTERLILSDALALIPAANVGDTLPGDITGVLDYSFGNYMLDPLSSPSVQDGGITPGQTRAQTGTELAVATYNVENLDPTDPAAKFTRLAEGVVDNLSSPDIVVVEEIQDNDGATDDGVVAADKTWGKLSAAISAAGGPSYRYRQIDPTNDQDGGEPGGNIRVGFLFRTDRGLSFVDRSPGDATTATGVTVTNGHVDLTHSPGRIAPTDSAWQSSRKPLAGEFLFNGHRVFVVANHFNSKGGDQPLMGRYQPPARGSETQRHAQATLVHDFVGQLQSADPQANVVVLGDLNDFEFSTTASILTGAGSLLDLPDTLPVEQRYTYDYEGNSEVLDHLLVSSPLQTGMDYEIVHINSEFAGQTSDHDPQIVRVVPTQG